MARSHSSLLCEARTGTIIDHRSVPLEQLRQNALTEIDRHAKHGGRYAICGTPFPCERVVLAETALGLF